MKILVGMSGGVDSSVTAALILKSGADAVGATLQLYSSCDAGISDDAKDAKAVCERLGIEHRIISLEDKFRKTVITRFANEYEAGRTPNPCIECNRHIKFGEMFNSAESLGCDKIATGHYARIKSDGGRTILMRPVDRSKDQTYVLYSLTQEQLSKTLFPLGEYTKPQVRELAAEYGFESAAKPDSQDICFVPDGDYAGFIERFTGKSFPQGDYVDSNGNTLGRHKGIIHYTIGQRKGLGIALGHPVFVLDKDVASNRVILGEESELFSKFVEVENINYIALDPPTEDLKVYAKLRYRHNEQPAVLHPVADGRAILEFDQPQRAASPGQAAVFYDGDTVIGGGTILKGRNFYE